jgi:hypothetical protein
MRNTPRHSICFYVSLSLFLSFFFFSFFFFFLFSFFFFFLFSFFWERACKSHSRHGLEVQGRALKSHETPGIEKLLQGCQRVVATHKRVDGAEPCQVVGIHALQGIGLEVVEEVDKKLLASLAQLGRRVGPHHKTAPRQPKKKKMKEKKVKEK